MTENSIVQMGDNTPESARKKTDEAINSLVSSNSAITKLINDNNKNFLDSLSKLKQEVTETLTKRFKTEEESKVVVEEIANVRSKLDLVLTTKEQTDLFLQELSARVTDVGLNLEKLWTELGAKGIVQPGNLFEDFKRGSFQTKELYFNFLNFFVMLAVFKNTPYCYTYSDVQNKFSLDPSTWLNVNGSTRRYTYDKPSYFLVGKEPITFKRDEFISLYRMHTDGYFDRNYPYLDKLPTTITLVESDDNITLSEAIDTKTLYVYLAKRVFLASTIDIPLIAEIVIILGTMSWNKVAGQLLSLFTNSIKSKVSIDSVGSDFIAALPKLISKIGG